MSLDPTDMQFELDGAPTTAGTLVRDAIQADVLADADDSVQAKFNPSEPRNPHTGEWVGTGGAAGALKDTLKLAGKIDLAPDEHLVGSGKVDGDFGTVRLALTDLHGKKSLRIGIGDSAFGSRDDEAGPWRAGPDSTAAINVERKKLRDEEKSLQGEWDRTTDPTRKAAIEKRLDELDDMATAEVYPSGYTAKLDDAGARELHTTVADALGEAQKLQAKSDALFAEIDRLEAQRNKLRGMGRKWTAEEDATWDRLTEQIDALQAKSNGSEFDYKIFGEGTVPGQWADVHYRVDLDDYSIGPQVRLGAAPPGISLEDLIDTESLAGFDAAEARKFLRLLGQYVGSGVQAAAGMDTHPGGEELKHYWVYGEGAAKWSTWTELRDHLLKYLNPEMAKRTAAEWFHLRYGDWPGSDTNKVRHGKPPRGHLVGPG